MGQKLIKVVVLGILALTGCKPTAITKTLDEAGSGDRPRPGTSSLFDKLIEKAPGGKIPQPFTALADYVGQYAEQQFGVLLPIGRSLQKNMAEPNYFASPRVVVTFGNRNRYMEPRRFDAAGMVFLGFQAAANQVEVISYNEDMGRFEFQLIEQYDSKEPKLRYEKRDACTLCHKAGLPIFPEGLVWSETNVGPVIGSLIRRYHASGFYQKVPTNYRTAEVVLPLDDNLRRVSSIPPVNQLWKDGCQGATAEKLECRAGLLLESLAHGLEYQGLTQQRLAELFPRAAPLRLSKLTEFDTKLKDMSSAISLGTLTAAEVFAAPSPPPPLDPKVAELPYSRRYIYERPHLPVLASAIITERVLDDNNMKSDSLDGAFALAKRNLEAVTNVPAERVQKALAALAEMRGGLKTDAEKAEAVYKTVESGFVFLSLIRPLDPARDPSQVFPRDELDVATARRMFVEKAMYSLNAVSRIRRAASKSHVEDGATLILEVAGIDFEDAKLGYPNLNGTVHVTRNDAEGRPSVWTKLFASLDCERVGDKGRTYRCTSQAESDNRGQDNVYGPLTLYMNKDGSLTEEWSEATIVKGPGKGRHQLRCASSRPKQFICGPFEFARIEAAIASLVEDNLAGTNTVLASDVFQFTKVADEVARRLGVDLATEEFRNVSSEPSTENRPNVNLTGASDALKDFVHFCGSCHDGSLTAIPAFIKGANAGEICREILKQANRIGPALNQGTGDESYMPPAASTLNAELTSARREAMSRALQGNVLCRP